MTWLDVCIDKTTYLLLPVISVGLPAEGLMVSRPAIAKTRRPVRGAGCDSGGEKSSAETENQAPKTKELLLHVSMSGLGTSFSS
jgi:hypothetical protein